MRAPINETSWRDLSLHYEGGLVYDKHSEVYCIVAGTGDGGLYLRTSEDEDVFKVKGDLPEICDRFEAVTIEDGYLNMGRAAVLQYRRVDRSYKKCTNAGRSQVFIPCQKFLARSRHKTPSCDVVSLASKSRAPMDIHAGLAILRAKKAASVALSKDFALARPSATGNPVLWYYTKAVGVVTYSGKVFCFVPHIRELMQKRGIL